MDAQSCEAEEKEVMGEGIGESEMEELVLQNEVDEEKKGDVLCPKFSATRGNYCRIPKHFGDDKMLRTSSIIMRSLVRLGLAPSPRRTIACTEASIASHCKNTAKAATVVKPISEYK